MANWACVPYIVLLFTVMIYSARLEGRYFYLCAFFFGTVVNSIPEQLIATIKGQCMWGPHGFGVPPDDVVPSLIMALLTEIHYLFIQSPLDIKGECSQTTGFATVKSYWCGFVSYSWKVVTASSLAPDDSVDLRLGWWGWYLTLFATQFDFHTSSRFLSLSPSVSQTLFSRSLIHSLIHRDMHTLFVCRLLVAW